MSATPDSVSLAPYRAASDHLARVRSEMARVIVGQQELVHRLLVALVARGHILLEGLPGLAQTAGLPLDVEAVKRSAGMLFDAFSRIDDKLHGAEGSTYAEEAETIGRELGSFRAFLIEHKP